jgi:DNA-binding HxlR family transcriptional regulator
MSSKSWTSLKRRSLGIPILELLIQTSNLTFGKIMESLKTSKKGLYLALIDLEQDGLIQRFRRGRYTYVKITSEGKKAVLDYSSLREGTPTLIDQILDETITQLEKEGIISQKWDNVKRTEFINKLKMTLEKQLEK